MKHALVERTNPTLRLDCSKPEATGYCLEKFLKDFLSKSIARISGEWKGLIGKPICLKTQNLSVYMDE